MMMAVSFERSGGLYYLDPGPHSPAVGTKVLVPTDTGPEVAECIWAPQWVDDDIGGLSVCAGLATDEHLTRDEANRARRAEGRGAARRVGPGVELRQIGPRDEARLQGGIGPCGRDLCCATFLKDFEPVSVRMAKDQELPVNPLRIAGACGRLMCCLKYEHPLYQDFKEKAPRIGASVESPEGRGTVVGHKVPADQVVVKLAEDGRRHACPRASVCGSRQAYEAKYGAEREAPPDR